MLGWAGKDASVKEGLLEEEGQEWKAGKGLNGW